MARKPNILWIMTDQHRADCLGYMGHPAVQTPNLDRLAKTSVVFENAFCQSPACMASRASLFTGRYPGSIRVHGMGILPPGETTTPELLQRAGYRTGAFGKVHLTPELFTRERLKSDVPVLDWRRFAGEAKLTPVPDDPAKKDYGFQVHAGCDDKNQGNFRAWLKARNARLLEASPQKIPGAPPDLFVSPYPSAFHPTTYIAEQAARFIRDRPSGQPWFAFCSFVAPHHPFEAPSDQIARYDQREIPLPDRKGGVEASAIPAPAAEAIGEMERWPEHIQRRIVLHYLASISLIDDAVGRLLQALEESGQRENCIILFLSDHGEFLGNHGLLRKPSLHYDETLRVPLLLHAPNAMSSARRVEGMVELIDLHPTLLGLLGQAVNPGVQGIDWSRQIRSGRPIGRKDIYAEMHDMPSGPYMSVLTLRTERWKLNLYPTAESKHGQLFDLRKDPDESRNLYHEGACRDTREEMIWRLVQRSMANTDPLPLRLSQW